MKVESCIESLVEEKAISRGKQGRWSKYKQENVQPIRLPQLQQYTINLVPEAWHPSLSAIQIYYAKHEELKKEVQKQHSLDFTHVLENPKQKKEKLRLNFKPWEFLMDQVQFLRFMTMAKEIKTNIDKESSFEKIYEDGSCFQSNILIRV